MTCGGDIKLDYWTSAGKKTKLRNVKCVRLALVPFYSEYAEMCNTLPRYPVSLRVAAAATGGASLIASVSLGGSKR